MATTASNTLPLLTLDAASSGRYVGAQLTLPLLTLEAQAHGGTGITASNTLPLLQLTARTGMRARNALPLLQLTAVGITSHILTASNTLPMLQLTAAAYQSNRIVASNALPLLTVYARSRHSGVSTAEITLPLLRLTANAITGRVATGSNTLPMLELTAQAYNSVVITASNTLPLLQLDARSYSTLVENWRAWVLNLAKGALTEYDNFEFDSFAFFNGKLYAVGLDGLFALDTSATDDDVEIDATVKGGKPDFGSSLLKRVPRLYVTLTQDGDMEVHTFTSQDGQRRYLLPHNDQTALQQRRVPIGKGPKSRYWQFGFANRDGADFSISSYIAYPTTDGRRIF